MLVLGEKGLDVVIIQQLLGVEPSGEYDEHTQAAVKNFQLRVGEPATGNADNKTLELILKRLGSDIDTTVNDEVQVEDLEATTDLAEITATVTIDEYLLPDDEYVTDQGEILDKKYIIIHHTAGGADPFKTIDDWANDARGRIGTQYIIGGIDIRDRDAENDGRIVKCIPDEYFAFHLGGYKSHNIDRFMHKHSIGIEICNFGWLTERDGEFYTYTGQLIDTEYVDDLGFAFRGHRYWHKYTEEQISSLQFLIESLSETYNIDIYNGLKERLESSHPGDAFEFYEEAVHGEIRGLLSHTSIRKDKTDVSPQAHLVEMIQNLNNMGLDESDFSEPILS